MSQQPISVFVSYSHKDEALKNELINHLKILQRMRKITAWTDRAIDAGSEWKEEIMSNLNSAQIILLLVSSDFIASDFCWNVEMEVALKRHELREARVVPIILRTVNWKEAPFSKLQGLPIDAKPVTSWDDQDVAFTNISKGIEKEVEKLLANPQ